MVDNAHPTLLQAYDRKMKSFLAYAITFFLAPTLGTLIAIPFMPIQLKLFKGIPLVNFCIGLLTVWLGTVILSWFGLKPTILMIIVLYIGFIINSLRELWVLPKAWLFLIVELAGVATGAFLFVIY
jgi:hypothetical protein